MGCDVFQGLENRAGAPLLGIALEPAFQMVAVQLVVLFVPRAQILIRRVLVRLQDLKICSILLPEAQVLHDLL